MLVHSTIVLFIFVFAVVQTILISIKSLINVTKRVNGLKQLAKYIENGQKLSFAQFKVIYTTNIEKSAYAFNEAKLLSLAKTSLTKDDCKYLLL